MMRVAALCVGLALCLSASAHAADATTTTKAATAQKSHAKQAPPPETDFDCAVHVAYGEARNTSKQEEAVVVNLLLERARRAHISVCKAAHRYFAPRKGSTAGIIAAVKNVLQGDKSLVPIEFLHVTEMRGDGAPEPDPDKFRRIGSVAQEPANGLVGNVFYEPMSVKPYQPPK